MLNQVVLEHSGGTGARLREDKHLSREVAERRWRDIEAHRRQEAWRINEG